MRAIATAVIPLAAACHADEPLQAPPPQVTRPEPRLVATIEFESLPATLMAGDTLRVHAIARDSLGTVVRDPTVTWTSSDTTVARIDTTGLIAALAVGTATILATILSVSEGFTLTVIPRPNVYRGHHVTPAGSPAGDGTAERPWDLASALLGAGGRVRPGDTIWVHGGTYRGPLTSTVAGTADAPVIIRQYGRERATIDGAGNPGSTFVVRGEWSTFHGLEITNTDPVRRTTNLSHVWRPNGVVNYASHTRYIGLIVHDAGVGFYTDPQAADVEILDGIFFNNGWQGPDRGHGHGLYLKSHAGPILARGNIVFNQFGYGIHAYTDAGDGGLNGIQLIDNIAFNNGTLSDNSFSSNLLLGGAESVRAGRVEGNLTYFSAGTGRINVELGFRSFANIDAGIRGNVMVGGSPVLSIGSWERLALENNVLVGSAELVSLLASGGNLDWRGTQHYAGAGALAWSVAGQAYDWTQWRTLTGLGADDVVNTGVPAGTQVILRRHTQDHERATLVVFNWSRSATVTVNLSSLMEVGRTFEIRTVQDVFGSPVLSGTWQGGDISLPLTAVAPPQPIGVETGAPLTSPEFYVFLVTTR